MDTGGYCQRFFSADTKPRGVCTSVYDSRGCAVYCQHLSALTPTPRSYTLHVLTSAVCPKCTISSARSADQENGLILSTFPKYVCIIDVYTKDATIYQLSKSHFQFEISLILTE